MRKLRPSEIYRMRVVSIALAAAISCTLVYVHNQREGTLPTPAVIALVAMIWFVVFGIFLFWILKLAKEIRRRIRDYFWSKRLMESTVSDLKYKIDIPDTRISHLEKEAKNLIEHMNGVIKHLNEQLSNYNSRIKHLEPWTEPQRSPKPRYAKELEEFRRPR